MNPKIKLALHIIGQVLAQGAVAELVPVQYKPILAAVVAIVGVLIAFSDNPNAPTIQNTQSQPDSTSESTPQS